MTRDDAISRQVVLDLIVANHTELNGVNVVMYSPLCKDIKQLPPIKQEPSGNLISRQAVLDLFKTFWRCFASNADEEIFKKEIAELPPINPQEPMPIMVYPQVEGITPTVVFDCDRNICIKNEYNGIGCDECEVTKSQEVRGDAISRQAVLDKIRSEIDFHSTTFIHGERYIEKDFALDIIDKYREPQESEEV